MYLENLTFPLWNDASCRNTIFWLNWIGDIYLFRKQCHIEVDWGTIRSVMDSCGLSSSRNATMRFLLNISLTHRFKFSWIERQTFKQCNYKLDITISSNKNHLNKVPFHETAHQLWLKPAAVVDYGQKEVEHLLQHHPTCYSDISKDQPLVHLLWCSLA